MPQCIPCEQILSCNDNPLAITGSVITFLTFAYAIATTLYIYMSRLKASEHEIDKLIISAKSNYNRLKLIGPVQNFEASGLKIDPTLKDLLNTRMGEVQRAFVDLEGALSWALGDGLPMNRRHLWKQSGRFVLTQSQMKAKVMRAENGV